MKQLKLTHKAVQIIGVAGVVWYGETAVTDGHLAFSKRQREEAQLVQQTSQSLGEQSAREPVTQTNVKDSRTNTRAHRVTTDPAAAGVQTGGSTARLTHPDICFCGDDLVVVEIHHLGGSI